MVAVAAARSKTAWPALAVCTAVLLGACSGSSTNGGPSTGATTETRTESAASVIKRLGAVPIPSAQTDEPTPLASRQHPQLLAMGAPVRVEAAGAAATITSVGPYEVTPYRGGTTLPTSTLGIITIKAIPTLGAITLRAVDFLSRDETGRVVSLRPNGPARVTATPGHPASIHIEGRFRSGAAQVTWRFQGAVLVMWDFNVELD